MTTVLRGVFLLRERPLPAVAFFLSMPLVLMPSQARMSFFGGSELRKKNVNFERWIPCELRMLEIRVLMHEKWVLKLHISPSCSCKMYHLGILRKTHETHLLEKSELLEFCDFFSIMPNYCPILK